MPTRLSAGPLQVTSLDLTSVNYMLQQVRRELDEIKGLRGETKFLGDVNVVGSLTLDAPLPWLTSGITGTANTVAAFGATGATAVLTRTGSGTIAVLQTSPTIITPTIASFVNATHTHQNAAGGGTLDHGLALTGLTDDDHSAYLLASSATSRAFFATSWTDLTDGGATTLHSHASAGVTGSGTAGRVAFWDGASSLSSDADMTFSTDTLTVTKLILGGLISMPHNTYIQGLGSDAIYRSIIKIGTDNRVWVGQSLVPENHLGQNFGNAGARWLTVFTDGLDIAGNITTATNAWIGQAADGSGVIFGNSVSLNGITGVWINLNSNNAGGTGDFLLGKDRTTDSGGTTLLTVDYTDGFMKLNSSTSYLDLSSITAGAKNIKFVKTTDTPTVTWDITNTIIPSTAPQGYMEIDDGSGTVGYIPYWR